MNRKGKITLGVTTIIILLVALTNAAGYIGNAIVDPANRMLWGSIALVVFIAAGIAEILKGGD